MTKLPTKLYERNCKLCNYERRDELEAYVMNNHSYNRNAIDIEEVFGLKVSPKSLKTHMTTHVDTTKLIAMRTLMRVGQETLGDAFDSLDFELPLSDAIVNMLMATAIARILKGEIVVKDAKDAMDIVKLSQGIKVDLHKMRMDERKLEIEEGVADMSTDDAIRQLGYIMEALRSSATTPELRGFLYNAVMVAMNMGMSEQFTSLAEVYRNQDWVETDMSAVVKDVGKFQRPLSRHELTTGDIVDVEDEDVPPDE